MHIKHTRNAIKKYKVPTMRLAILWLQNYEAFLSFKDVCYFVKFESIDGLVNNFVMAHEKVEDVNGFRFRLVPEDEETDALKWYLFHNKDFVIKYVKENEYFMGTHLYQFYLQYLSYELNDKEKTFFLDGYFHMMSDLYGKDYTLQRKKLEKQLRLVS